MERQQSVYGMEGQTDSPSSQPSLRTMGGNDVRRDSLKPQLTERGSGSPKLLLPRDGKSQCWGGGGGGGGTSRKYLWHLLKLNPKK